MGLCLGAIALPLGLIYLRPIQSEPAFLSQPEPSFEPELGPQTEIITDTDADQASQTTTRQW